MNFKSKSQISFFLTTQCNLECIYCYMPKNLVDEPDRIIDLDFCAVGLEDFFSNNKSRCIRFFASGEPTLEFERMKKIRDIAYSMVGDELRVELETNGYFDTTIADWIEKYVDYLWISCDGNQDIQSTQRPSINGICTSELIEQNIARLAQCNQLQFGVRATIMDDNLYKQTELIDYFKGLGVKYVSASPAYASKPNEITKTQNLLDFAKGFAVAYQYALDNNMFYNTLFIVNFDEETDVFCQALLPNPRLTTDGYVSCCDWVSLGDKYYRGIMQQCVYGKYNKITKKIDYDAAKIENIRMRNTGYLGKTTCVGCRALRHCAGGCIGKVMSQTDSMFVPYKPWCEAILYLYDNIKIPEHGIPFLHP